MKDKSDHLAAREHLNEALAELHKVGQLLPCAGQLDWISEERARRKWAAVHCAPCPVLLACREAGKGERVGVWGGVDVTKGP